MVRDRKSAIDTDSVLVDSAEPSERYAVFEPFQVTAKKLQLRDCAPGVT